MFRLIKRNLNPRLSHLRTAGGADTHLSPAENSKTKKDSDKR